MIYLNFENIFNVLCAMNYLRNSRRSVPFVDNFHDEKCMKLFDRFVWSWAIPMPSSIVIWSK